MCRQSIYRTCCDTIHSPAQGTIFLGRASADFWPAISTRRTVIYPRFPELLYNEMAQSAPNWTCSRMKTTCRAPSSSLPFRDKPWASAPGAPPPLTGIAALTSELDQSRNHLWSLRCGCRDAAKAKTRKGVSNPESFRKQTHHSNLQTLFLAAKDGLSVFYVNDVVLHPPRLSISLSNCICLFNAINFGT